MFEFLAIDWGQKKFGLAFGNKTTGLIIPSVKENFSVNIFALIQKEVAERKIKTFVVGIPTNKSLEITEVTTKINSFIQELSKTFPTIPIKTINERQSTKVSKQLLGPKQKDKHLINNLAATQILEYFFNQID